MPSTVEQLSPTRVKITVEVPFTDFKPSLDKAYAAIARQVNIPGFRKGKVPPLVIDQRFGRGVVIQEAFNDAWSGFYGQAVQENRLSPLAQPDLEVTKLEDGDLIEFTAEVDVRPDFELPEFSSLTATVEPLEVPDALVDKQIEGLQQRFGSRQTVERPAADGDVVTISLVASKEGETLEDATADDLDYTIGSGTMLEGLDEAVTGLSAGESATFASTLVGGTRTGEPADIQVTVSKVAEQELPAADDELAQQASEFDTIDELRADVRERLTRVARLEQAGQARDAVLETLLEQLELDVPDNLRESEINARREQITSQLAQAGLSVEQYLADTEEDSTPEEFWADIEGRAVQAIKAQMVLDKVAEERDVSIDQNDMTQHILRKAQAEGIAPQQIAEHLNEHPHHIEEYALEIRRAKALALIVEAADVTDTTGAKVELATLAGDGSYTTDAPAESADDDEVEPEEQREG